MLSPLPAPLRLALALFCAGALSHACTPAVKRLAEAIGAVDRPGGRRVNERPVPRMGGLAICLGFLAAAALTCGGSSPLAGLLRGAVLVAVMGFLDDVFSLPATLKLLLQLVAALAAARGGALFTTVTGLHGESLLLPGWLALPLTLLWIVCCTNAVNLIDGLDGLAVGVSAIGSLAMLLVALLVSEPLCALLLAALTGACLGFLPFNRNPARIFMGDVGSQFLGYVLAVVSVLGTLKFHTLVSFFVPLLALSVPLGDTLFAFVRRLARGQSPFHADKNHIHHRLLAMGMNQKQAVAVLYGVSSALALLAVPLSGGGALLRALCLALAAALSLGVCRRLFLCRRGAKEQLVVDKTEKD